jgi:two-component system, LytTR family, sensor kinase
MQRVWIGLAWLAFALFNASKVVGDMRSAGMHHNWALLFTIEVLDWLPWALATAMVVELARRMRSIRRPAAWGVHAVAALAIDALCSGWATLLTFTFRPFDELEKLTPMAQWQSSFYENLPSTLVFYACVLVLNEVFESHERLERRKAEVAELKGQLAQATLGELRRQIEPHFLFNSLNAVTGLVREGKGAVAVDMLVNLSDLLRRAISGDSRQEVKLEEELDFAQRYLATEKIRFADRLRLEIDVADDVRRAAVPHFILQPIVENALKHGISKRREGGLVRIAALAQDDRLRINVSNDGPAPAVDWEVVGTGVGIANVRARLTALYGSGSSFELRARADGGAEATIHLPLRVA